MSTTHLPTPSAETDPFLPTTTTTTLPHHHHQKTHFLHNPRRILHHSTPNPPTVPKAPTTPTANPGPRLQLRHHLSSKTAHYTTLLLVVLDVGVLFAAFALELATCETRVPVLFGRRARRVLDDASQVFTCVFLLEVGLGVWAFGREYFHSPFACFDALVVVSEFIIDVVLKGVLADVGSLVVVLRLWRVFEMIEELSNGEEEETRCLKEKIAVLERENKDMRGRVSGGMGGRLELRK